MEVKFITVKKKTEVIRFKVSSDEKARIKQVAKKRGITVSEYLRQAVSNRSSCTRPTDWHKTVTRLEEICASADGEVREKLIEIIRSLYRGGA